MTQKNLLLLLTALLFFCTEGRTQPDNYWSVSFNSEASLLSGAVVGGNSDITSIYYNPAGISEIENKKISINANLFNLSNTKYENAVGKDLNLDYLGFTVQPRFVSYVFKIKKIEKLAWQFAIFNRDNKRISVYDQIKQPVQLISPGIYEEYNCNIDFKSEYIDSWGGFGTAYQLNDKLTMGGSFLFSLKDFKYTNLINIDVYPTENNNPPGTDNYYASSDSYENVILIDVRFIGKLGIRYQLTNLSFGLNLSLPSVKLFGNSNVKRNISNTGVADGGVEVEDSYLNESAVFLKSQLKDPLSIALGLVYSGSSGKSSFYFTTEYFHGIENYKAIDGTQTINSKYEPATDFLSYKCGTKAIINTAVGAQYHLSEKFEYFMGFKTNFSPYEVSDEQEFVNINEFVNTPTDLYTFSGGSKFNYKNFSIIAGMEFTFGSSSGHTEFINVLNPTIQTENKLYMSGATLNNMNYTYYALGFYFGFTYGF